MFKRIVCFFLAIIIFVAIPADTLALAVVDDLTLAGLILSGLAALGFGISAIDNDTDTLKSQIVDKFRAFCEEYDLDFSLTKENMMKWTFVTAMGTVKMKIKQAAVLVSFGRWLKSKFSSGTVVEQKPATDAYEGIPTTTQTVRVEIFPAGISISNFVEQNKQSLYNRAMDTQPTSSGSWGNRRFKTGLCEYDFFSYISSGKLCVTFALYRNGVRVYTGGGASGLSYSATRGKFIVYRQGSNYGVAWFWFDNGVIDTYTGNLTSYFRDYILNEGIAVETFPAQPPEGGLSVTFPETMPYDNVATGTMGKTAIDEIADAMAQDGAIAIDEAIPYPVSPSSTVVGDTWDYKIKDTPVPAVLDEVMEGVVGDIADGKEIELVTNDDREDDDEKTTEEDIGAPQNYLIGGLENIFPFCIPFDLIYFLGQFEATREAPAMDITIPFPEALGGEYTFSIDLSPWDDVAEILRTLELLAFIVALILVTRHLIRS